MICINCGCAFHRKPVQQYFCSRMCWQDATANTPWRILAEGVTPIAPASKLTTTARFPRPLWPMQRSRLDDMKRREARV